MVESDEHQLPRIEEMIGSLNGNRLFSTIDLEGGFSRASIRDTDEDKRAFYTKEKLLLFKMIRKYLRTIMKYLIPDGDSLRKIDRKNV